jgi:hypothetical protein
MNYNRYRNPNPNRTANINSININWKLNDLINELDRTTDPIERLMISQFIRIKKRQNELNYKKTGKTGETESLDSLSAEDKYDLDSDSNDSDVSNKKSKKISSKSKSNNKSNAEKELERFEKIRKDSLKQLKKIEIDKARKEAYSEILDDVNDVDDSSDDQIDAIYKQRGDNEKHWDNKDMYNSDYARYAKEDKLNNRMMERLNSEIDFRLTGNAKDNIVKPFDDNNNVGITDTFAHYNNTQSKSR